MVWVNKVGPYNNPQVGNQCLHQSGIDCVGVPRFAQETYNYNYLPFCRPNPSKKAEHSWGGLGEVLEGNEVGD